MPKPIRKAIQPLAAAIVCFVQSPAQDVHSIYGLWRFPVQESNGITFTFRLFFYRSATSNHDQILESVLCSGADGHSVAKVDVPVDIHEKTFKVLEDSVSDAPDGEFPCRAIIHKEELQYSVSEDGQHLYTTDGQETVTLDRQPFKTTQ